MAKAPKSAFGRRNEKKAAKKVAAGYLQGFAGGAMIMTGGLLAGSGNPLGVALMAAGTVVGSRGGGKVDVGRSMQAKGNAIDDLIRRSKKRKDQKAKEASDGLVKAHYRTMPNGITTFVKAHKRSV